MIGIRLDRMLNTISYSPSQKPAIQESHYLTILGYKSIFCKIVWKPGFLWRSASGCYFALHHEMQNGWGIWSGVYNHGWLTWKSTYSNQVLCQIGLPIISPTATDPNLNNPHWAGTLARLSPSNEVLTLSYFSLTFLGDNFRVLLHTDHQYHFISLLHFINHLRTWNPYIPYLCENLTALADVPFYHLATVRFRVKLSIVVRVWAMDIG